MGSATEFRYNSPTAWRGFTTIEAAAFLREALPAETQWMVWVPEHLLMKRLFIAGGPDHGTAEAWRWQRIPCAYPALFYYQEAHPEDHQRMWTGLVEVTAPDERRFFVFSYLNAAGEVGVHYFVSAPDTELLADFSGMLRRRLAATETITIAVPRGDDLRIEANASEYLCLPETMRMDIERQALSFFENETTYRDLGIPHRRGFLFVGPPGCGKTMTIRHLIRKIHRQTTVSCLALKTHPYLDAETLVHLFNQARRAERAIVVIEDIERVGATDSSLRPALLGLMDGLASNRGLLVLATTNHPEDVDPALSKRPSRFDRTWVFSLPDETLRRDYLTKTLGSLGEDVVATAVRRTSGWSFAFLNELRVTAAVLAMNQNAPLGVVHVTEALDILGRQFKAGKDGFKDNGSAGSVGFSGAP